MQVEWTSYNSPIGALTVVECEAGPAGRRVPSSRHDDQMGGAAARRRARAAHRPGHLPDHHHLARRILRRILPCPSPTPIISSAGSISRPPRSPSSRRCGRSPSARPAPTTTSPARPDCIPGRSGGWSRPITWRSSSPATGWWERTAALVGYGGGLAKKRWLLDHELAGGGGGAAVGEATRERAALAVAPPY